MRKGKTVMGQGVYSLDDGVKIDSVKDLLINDENDAIVALLVDEGGLMASSKVIPIGNVYRFGPSAVMVSSSSVLIEADDDERVRSILDRDATLLDRAVLTYDGDDLGKISDMYFDERSGEIHGFEVSGGRIGDVLRGTSYLTLKDIEVVGPDAVITRAEAKEHLEAQKGGLVGAAEDAQKRAGEMQQQVEGMAEEARDPDATLVGRRSGRDVSDRTGSIIVANGQRIDLEDVQQAREAGVIDDLYAAVGAERQKSAGEQAQEAAGQATDTAQDLWDRFTNKLSELTDSAGKRFDAEQTKGQLAKIHDAIGRPVTKAILDREDDVILDVGDLITHQAVQRAHENGMLQSMLDSVYVAQVTFERDELKAKIPGEARVEEASGGARVIEELEQKRDELEQPSDDQPHDLEQSSVQQPQSKQPQGKAPQSTGKQPQSSTGKQPQPIGGQSQPSGGPTSPDADRSQGGSTVEAGAARATQSRQA
jgi:uncharacterized protein YrrD